MSETLTGIIPAMDEATYHARPELSSTEARLLLSSPAKHRWRKDNPPILEPSTKFDVGSAVHAKVLGTGYEIVVVDAPDWRTKAAQIERDEARIAGKVPLLSREYDVIEQTAEAVLAHPTARALFTQAGTAEASVFASISGVDVRARFDYLPHVSDRRLVAVDLKTTVDASPQAFEKSIASYGYDVQRAWYLDALDAAVGPFAEHPEMVFVAVEKEPPYLVAVYQLSQQWADMGHIKANRARALYKQCTESGIWPGYPEAISIATPPTWAVYQFEEQYK